MTNKLSDETARDSGWLMRNLFDAAMHCQMVTILQNMELEEIEKQFPKLYKKAKAELEGNDDTRTNDR